MIMDLRKSIEYSSWQGFIYLTGFVKVERFLIKLAQRKNMPPMTRQMPETRTAVFIFPVLSARLAAKMGIPKTPMHSIKQVRASAYDKSSIGTQSL